MAWSVQARWTVGDEERSYAPVHANSERDARKTAKQMRRTLWHFPTLEVVITELAEASALAASEESELAESHLADSPAATHAACGLRVEGLAALCFNTVLFRSLGRPCPSCLAAAGS